MRRKMFVSGEFQRPEWVELNSIWRKKDDASADHLIVLKVENGRVSAFKYDASFNCKEIRETVARIKHRSDFRTSLLGILNLQKNYKRVD